MMNSSGFQLPKTVDTLFTWYSTTIKSDCHCRLRIYQLAFDCVVIIVSECFDNPGRSITDEAPTLINLVCYRFGYAPAKVMWIEHYPDGYLKEKESYHEVMRTVGHLSSKKVTRQQLEELLGVCL